MPFRNRNRNQDFPSQPPSTKRPEKSGWDLVEAYASGSKAAVDFVFLILIVAVVVFEFRFWLDASSQLVQSLLQITTDLSALSLAIPLFMKDVRRKPAYWRLFFLAAFIFFISTILSIIVIIAQPMPAEVHGVAVFVFAALVVVVVSGSNFLRRALVSEKIEVTVTIILVALCVWAAPNLISALFVVLTYGFFLVSALMVAILLSAIVGVSEKTADEERLLDLKKAIQNVVENHPERAFEEDDLLIELRSGQYKEKMDCLSHEQIQEAVEEMHSEADPESPRLTIHGYDL